MLRPASARTSPATFAASRTGLPDVASSTFAVPAAGVVAAVKAVGLQVPLVVRLEGTNVEEGKKIIRESGLNVLPADDLDDAAQKIVKAVKGK